MKLYKVIRIHRQTFPCTHHCHARDCKTPCKPEMLMCLRHWTMVPYSLRRLVWKNYRRGQCDDKRPSRAWFKAADDAIEAVAAFEAKLKARKQ